MRARPQVSRGPGVGTSWTAQLCFATCGSSAGFARAGGEAAEDDVMSKPMSIDELRSLSVLEGLTDDQLAQLVRGGTEIRAEPGTELFREGEHADFWWVLLDGAID